MKNEMATTMKTTFEIDKPKGGVTMTHMMISTSFADRPSERERWRGSRNFEAFFILFFLTVPLEGNTLDKLHTPDFISTSPFLKNDMTSPQRRSSKQVPDGSLTIAKT